MYILMNHYLSKISQNGILRAPPGEGTPGGAGNDDGTQTNDDSQANDDDDGGDDDEDDLGADLGVNEDDDFDIGEYGGYQQTDEDKQAAVSLKENLEGILENMSLSDDLIPDDFDPSDPRQLRDVMVASNRQAAQQVLQMLIPVVNHGLGLAGKQMKHYIDTKGTQSKSQTAAADAFKSLGLTDPNHVALGKTVFQQALKSQKGDVQKALKATRRSFAALNIPVSGKAGGGGNRFSGGGNQQISSTKTGADALTDLFGAPPKVK